MNLLELLHEGCRGQVLEIVDGDTIMFRFYYLGIYYADKKNLCFHYYFFSVILFATVVEGEFL